MIVFTVNKVLILTLFLFSLNHFEKKVIAKNDKEVKNIVDHFGLLHVKGNKIVDKNEEPIALNGVSLFWSQWGGNFYNESCVDWLYKDWKCTVIRAACGVENGGYLIEPDKEMQKVTSVIDACIKTGIYVIVDWHDHHAQNHIQQSKEFFKTISQRYGDKPNIIYEIYNEPLMVSWSRVIRPYAKEVIKVIRDYDPDNLIIVGTSTWSQDVDIASKDTINDINLAYSFHFYTSTHTEWLRNKAITAMNNGIALFVSEYGISEANGTGTINYNETDKWFSFMDNYNLSACNWSIIDKDETSAALKPGTDPYGEWTEDDLSESGAFIRNRIRTLNIKLFEKI